MSYGEDYHRHEQRDRHHHQDRSRDHRDYSRGYRNDDRRDHYDDRRDYRDNKRDHRDYRNDRDYGNDRALKGSRRDQRSRSRDRRDGRSPHYHRSPSTHRAGENDFEDRDANREPVVALEDRERHLQNWDVPPPGFERIRADIAKKTGIFPPPGNITKMANYVPPPLDPARAALLATLSLEAGSSTMATTAPLALTLSHHYQYPRDLKDDGRAPAKRLRISHPALKEISMLGGKAAVAKFLDDFVNRTCKPHYDPTALAEAVSAVSLSPVDTSVAVVDFFSPEDAQLALDNHGRLTMHLASHYPALYSSESSPEFRVERCSGETEGSLLAEGSPHPQLVLYGLPPPLSPQHVRELLAPFGQLSSFIFVTRRGSEVGLGVVLFDMDEDIINDVVLQAFSKDNIAIGPSALRVCRLTELINAQDGEQLRIRRLLSAFDLLPVVSSGTASNVLQIFNLFDNKDPHGIDEAREQLETQIQGLLAMFGTVRHVVVPSVRDDPNAYKEWGVVPGQGRAYVQFSSATEAVQVLKAVAGTLCDGRTVYVGFYPPERFELCDF